jgi:hypothetical protein
MPRPLRALSALLLALVPICGAEAQVQSNLTLSPAAALWNDVVVARIDINACFVEAASPVVGFTTGVGWTVDIPLIVTACPIVAPPISIFVEIGPLYPQDYVVRVLDQSVVLDTAPLSIYREASVSVELPEVATDAAPFPLVLRGPASGGCFLLNPPEVQGNVITATFDDNCPVLPIPGAHIFEEEYMVGPLPAGEYEVRFFEYAQEPRPRLHRQTLIVYDADECVPSDTVLCLQDGRFRVEVDWKDFQNNTGPGHAIPLAGRDDSGLFWYFSKENIELTVKILNACDVVGDGGSWWVFLSSGSTVEYAVTVTDIKTHRTKTYTNDRGEAAPLVADTSAFPCAAP